MFFLVFSGVTAGLAGLMLFIYYFRQGQFDDMEDVKYEMFREEERSRRSKGRVRSVKGQREES